MNPSAKPEAERLQSNDGRFVVVRSDASMVEGLEAIQRAAFPTLAEHELTLVNHYRQHLSIFPEGQFAVRDEETGRVVASSTDLRVFVDFDHYQHTFLEATGDRTLETHQPEGDWLYGADIGVHPAYRGHGLSTLLYRARHELVRRLGLRGHVAGAMPTGYGAVQHEVAIEKYVLEVVREERRDPVLSVQLRRGYAPWGILPDYLEDPSCANYGVFIVWRNPEGFRE